MQIDRNITVVNRFQAVLTKVIEWADRFIRDRIVFVTDSRVDLNGQVSDRPALIAIVGCEHYRHQARSYPVRSAIDLRQVMRTELGMDSTTLRFIGRWSSDARRVDIFEMSHSPDVDRFQAAFLVPETLLLSRMTPANSMIKVSRGTLRYFLTGSGLWSRVTGLVVSDRAFVLASGEPIDRIDDVEGRALPDLLYLGIRRLSPNDLIDGLSRSFFRGFWQNYRPVAALIGIGLALYVLVLSSYVVGFSTLRESQIANLGSEVNKLLVAERKIDTLSAEGRAMVGLLEASGRSWRVWEIPAAVWAAGGRVSAFTVADGKVMIRGEVADAAGFLADLSKLRSISSPAFSSPVRQDRGMQQFVIELKIEQHPDGK